MTTQHTGLIPEGILRFLVRRAAHHVLAHPLVPVASDERTGIRGRSVGLAGHGDAFLVAGIEMGGPHVLVGIRGAQEITALAIGLGRDGVMQQLADLFDAFAGKLKAAPPPPPRMPHALIRTVYGLRHACGDLIMPYGDSARGRWHFKAPTGKVVLTAKEQHTMIAECNPPTYAHLTRLLTHLTRALHADEDHTRHPGGTAE